MSLDGKLQSSEVDYFVYHESLVHPAVVSLDHPKNALVLGGGEGTAAKELLKYGNIGVDWVDIDNKVVSVCKKYLPYSLKKPEKRMKVTIGDAYEFVFSTKKRYDIVIDDVTGPDVKNKLSNKLYTRKFAKRIFNILTDQGVFITTTTEHAKNMWISTYKPERLKDFPIIRPFQFYMPSFFDSFPAIFASKKYDPLNMDGNIIRKRLGKVDSQLLYYDEITHLHLFNLPKIAREFLIRT